MKLVKYLSLVFFVGVAVSAYSQAYPQNIVGYYKLMLYPGDNLIANQLDNDNNTLNAIFQPGVPEGATFTDFRLRHQHRLEHQLRIGFWPGRIASFPGHFHQHLCWLRMARVYS